MKELEIDPDLEDEETEPVGSGDTPLGRRLDPDAILDTLVPSGIDWRDSVRRHPMASVVVVGLAGYLVGRTKGAAIMAGLATATSTALMRQLSDVFEGDFFDFDSA